MTDVLATSRMTVRRFSPADAVPLHGICGDPATMRLVGDGTTLSVGRCAEWIELSLRHYAARGFGAFAVFVDGTSDMAGYCGIVPAPRRADPELIYAFRPCWWRQGLASELVPALIEFGFGPCRLRRLMATAVPRNAASRRVLEKSGMHLAGEELDDEGRVLLVYTLDAPGS
jgi:[ribosomal protein S5]-alanine N-acetyltransferase